jgi:hypothetical protein
MALDYSKLSEAELEAIANDDYSKLSNATLEAISSEGTDPSISMAPQAVSIGARVAGPVAEVAKDVGTTAYNVGKKVVGYPIDVAKNAVNWTPRSIAEVVGSPLTTAKQYIMNHPIMESNASLKSVGKNAGQYAKNIGSRIGSGLVAGAVAPESLFAMPYQMAAYEQEKIRANPTAPEYATNPYAQMIRGEAPTQGAAGAMNRRNAIAGQQYGGLTPEQQQILEQDKIDQAIRRKAAQKVLSPVAPTGQ